MNKKKKVIILMHEKHHHKYLEMKLGLVIATHG